MTNKICLSAGYAYRFVLMADEIKPPVSGSMSPGNQPPKPTSPPMDVGLPSNLPVKDVPRPSAPSGPFGADIKIKPPLPPISGSFAPKYQDKEQIKSVPSPISPPIKITPPPVPSRQMPTVSDKQQGQLSPFKQTLPEKPTAYPPLTSKPPVSYAPTISPPPVFKSSIRTMQEDLAAIKKGQQPMGVKLEKQSEKSEIKTQEPLISRIIPPLPRSQPRVELGGLEKSKLMFDEKRPVIPGSEKEKKQGFSFFGIGKSRPSATSPSLPSAVPSSGPVISVPPKEGTAGRWADAVINIGGKRRILYISVGAIVAMTLLVFWVFGNFFDRGEVVFSPTPTPTPTATPSVQDAIPFENYFSVVESLSINLTDFSNAFKKSINQETLKSANEPVIYRILDQNGIQRYGFRQIMDALSIQIPAGLQNTVSDKDFYLTSTIKRDGGIGYGFIVKVGDLNTAKAALSLWETSLTELLGIFFEYNSNEAASMFFLDNTYKGAPIKYRNFSSPDKTIDFSIINISGSGSYLVFTNSRDHMYQIIDKVR